MFLSVNDESALALWTLSFLLFFWKYSEKYWCRNRAPLCENGRPACVWSAVQKFMWNKTFRGTSSTPRHTHAQASAATVCVSVCCLSGGGSLKQTRTVRLKSGGNGGQKAGWGGSAAGENDWPEKSRSSWVWPQLMSGWFFRKLTPRKLWEIPAMLQILPFRLEVFRLSVV